MHDEGLESQCREAGGDGMLLKPIDRELLIATLAGLLKISAA